MNLSRLKYAVLALAVFVLSACGPAAPALSIDPKLLIQTIVAATVAAIPTSTPGPTYTPKPTSTIPGGAGVPTESPLLFASSTPIPSLTPLVLIFDTNTPNATLPPGVIGPDAPMYSCQELLYKPDRGEVVRPRETFQMVWKGENNGTAPWKEKEVKFVFLAGDKIYKDDPVKDIGYAVYPGERIRLWRAIQAPQDEGRYSAAWGLKLVKEDRLICSMEMYFLVVKPPPTSSIPTATRTPKPKDD